MVEIFECIENYSKSIRKRSYKSELHIFTIRILKYLSAKNINLPKLTVVLLAKF